MSCLIATVLGGLVRRILVVDDNKDASETLAVLLRQAGHRVETAPDGATALAHAQKSRPDVVLLDIGLPRMDGFEVARRLRIQHADDVPLLVALSGYGLDEDRQRAREAGFDHYFAKPVGFDTLRSFLAGLTLAGQ